MCSAPLTASPLASLSLEWHSHVMRVPPASLPPPLAEALGTHLQLLGRRRREKDQREWEKTERDGADEKSKWE